MNAAMLHRPFGAAKCTNPHAPLLNGSWITGNAAYYVPFMDALYDGFGGRADVLGVSNLGQCSRGLTSQVIDSGI